MRVLFVSECKPYQVSRKTAQPLLGIKSATSLYEKSYIYIYIYIYIYTVKPVLSSPHIKPLSPFIKRSPGIVPNIS